MHKYRFLIFEFLWLTITAIIALIIIFPIYQSLNLNYPFYFENILFVVVSSLCVKFIFFFEYSVLRNSIITKVILIFLTPFVFIYLIDLYFKYVSFGNDIGYQSLVTHLLNTDQMAMVTYIKRVAMFFSVSSLIGVLLMPFKMIRSIWRQVNNPNNLNKTL